MIPAVFLLGLPPSSTLLNCSQTYTMSFLIPLRNRYSKISNSSFLKLQIGHMIPLKDSSIGVRNAKGNGPDSPLWVQEMLTSDSRLWRQEQPLFAPTPNSVFEYTFSDISIGEALIPLSYLQNLSSVALKSQADMLWCTMTLLGKRNTLWQSWNVSVPVQSNLELLAPCIQATRL